MAVLCVRVPSMPTWGEGVTAHFCAAAYWLARAHMRTRRCMSQTCVAGPRYWSMQTLCALGTRHANR